MKTFFHYLPILLICGIFLQNKAIAQHKYHAVNDIIGDESFIVIFEDYPNQRTNENLRIQTHLNYVISCLEHADISLLSNEEIENRVQLINHLRDYSSAGIFPRNYEYEHKRVPCFIDQEGRICALGYLIEQTAGRAVAEEINSEMQYEYVMEMNSSIVDDWIANSGLSKKECAMIQPTYNYMEPLVEPEPIDEPIYDEPYTQREIQFLNKMNAQKSELDLLQQQVNDLSYVKKQNNELTSTIDSQYTTIEHLNSQLDSMTAVLITAEADSVKEELAEANKLKAQFAELKASNHSQFRFMLLIISLLIAICAGSTYLLIKKGRNKVRS